MAFVRRRAFNCLTGASLVLCLAAAVVWVWSYHQPIGVVWQTAAKRSWQMDCSAGEVSVVRRVGPSPPALGQGVLGQKNRTLPNLPIFPMTPAPARGPGLGPGNRGVSFSAYGFELQTKTAGGGARLDELAWPCWVMVFLTALLPAWWSVWWLRRRRAAEQVTNLNPGD